MSRIKTLESLAEKIETGRIEKWSEIDDLFACTIIIPTLSQEDEVIDFCKSTFHFIRMIKRGETLKAPDVFRFDSPRIYVQLSQPSGLELIEHPNIYDVIFEIQIRTAFEHAWSVTTHALAYKAPDIDWKRLHLAAQIKATVEQLDTLILAFEEAFPHISENPWPEIKAKRKIFKSVERFFEEGRIPSECSPKDLSRFCNNLYTLLQKASLEKRVNHALRTIEMEVTQTPTEVFPRSISLFQYFLAILVKNGIIVPSTLDQHYYCHISQELLQLYPELHNVEHSFNYEV